MIRALTDARFGGRIPAWPSLDHPEVSDSTERVGSRSGCSRHLLHGLGDDLIGLADGWAGALPGCCFLSPHAPEPCDMAPMGRQWFSIRDRSEAALRAGVERAAPALDAFIDGALDADGLGDDRLFLVGFSQGTMMALHVALRRRRAPAGVLGYSGRLIGAARLAEEAVPRPPVMLIHGDADDMVPVAALHEAIAALGAAGVPAQWRVCAGVGHGIAPDGLAVGARFLRDCLSPP